MLLVQLIKFIPYQCVPILIKLLLHYVTQVLVVVTILVLILIIGCLSLLLGLWHVLGKLHGLLTGGLLLWVVIPPLGWRRLGCVLHAQLLGILFNDFFFESGFLPVITPHISTQATQLQILSSLYHAIEIFLCIRLILQAIPIGIT